MEASGRKRKGKHKPTFEDDLAMAMAQSLQMEKEREEIFAALSHENAEKLDVLFPSLTPSKEGWEKEKEKEKEKEMEEEKQEEKKEEEGEKEKNGKSEFVWVSAAERMKQNMMKESQKKNAANIPPPSTPSSSPSLSSSSSSSSSSSDSLSQAITFTGDPLILGSVWESSHTLPLIAFGNEESELFYPIEGRRKEFVYTQRNFEDLSDIWEKRET